jgi:hypothetical protein
MSASFASMRWKPDTSAIAALCAKRTKTCESRCGIKGHGTHGIRANQETGELAGQRKVVLKADLYTIDLAPVLRAAMSGAPRNPAHSITGPRFHPAPLGELGR